MSSSFNDDDDCSEPSTPSFLNSADPWSQEEETDEEVLARRESAKTALTASSPVAKNFFDEDYVLVQESRTASSSLSVTSANIPAATLAGSPIVFLPIERIDDVITAPTVLSTTLFGNEASTLSPHQPKRKRIVPQSSPILNLDHKSRRV